MTMAAADLDGQHRLAYGDEQIVFTLRRQASRAKPSVAIHVEPDGRVEVDAPPTTPLAEVLAAVRQRSRWISQHVSAARARSAHVLPREYVSGESIHYQGRRYRLKIIVQAEPKPGVGLRGGFLVVVVPKHDAALIKPYIAAWYRDRAREVFAARLTVVAQPLRWVRQVPAFRLRFMTRQWGSCAPTGTLTLNPWLMAAPREAIDYVLLHELCHLKHHNHSRSFYAALTRLLPDWKRIKLRLDEQADAYLRQ